MWCLLTVNDIDFLNSVDYNGNENGLSEHPNENELYHNSGSSIQVLSNEEIEVSDSDSSEEELGDADNDEILVNGDSEGENYQWQIRLRNGSQ